MFPFDAIYWTNHCLPIDEVDDETEQKRRKHTTLSSRLFKFLGRPLFLRDTNKGYERSLTCTIVKYMAQYCTRFGLNFSPTGHILHRQTLGY